MPSLVGSEMCIRDRRIEVLKKAGLIQVFQTEKNHKIKYLVPTQASIDYFEKLGKLMTSAIRR